VVLGVKITGASWSGAARRKWLIGAGVAATVAVSYFLLHRLRGSAFRWERFVETLRQLDPGWFGASVALILLTYFGRAIRWRSIIRPVCPHPKLWRLFVATAIGFTATVLFGRAGELVRPYLIAVNERITFSSQVAAWLMERIYDLLIVLAIFGFALSQLQGVDMVVGPALQWVLRMGGYLVGGICSFCLIFLLSVHYFSNAMQRRFLSALTFLPEHAYKRVESVVEAFTAGMGSGAGKSLVFEIFVYTAVEWTIIVGSAACMFRAFPLTSHLTIVDTLIFVGFVSFGSAVQLPGIGGGMQVASVVVLTQLFGIDLESATGISLVIWASTYVVIVPVGIYFSLKEGLSWRKLKDIETEARLPE
jgi:glycosyltransferase 2 family protein